MCLYVLCNIIDADLAESRKSENEKKVSELVSYMGVCT